MEETPSVTKKQIEKYCADNFYQSRYSGRLNLWTIYPFSTRKFQLAMKCPKEEIICFFEKNNLIYFYTNLL
jgi:hypothetical protein